MGWGLVDFLCWEIVWIGEQFGMLYQISSGHGWVRCPEVCGKNAGGIWSG